MDANNSMSLALERFRKANERRSLMTPPPLQPQGPPLPPLSNLPSLPTLSREEPVAAQSQSYPPAPPSPEAAGPSLDVTPKMEVEDRATSPLPQSASNAHPQSAAATASTGPLPPPAANAAPKEIPRTNGAGSTPGPQPDMKQDSGNAADWIEIIGLLAQHYGIAHSKFAANYIAIMQENTAPLLRIEKLARRFGIDVKPVEPLVDGITARRLPMLIEIADGSVGS